MRRRLVEADEECIVDRGGLGEALDILGGLVGDIDQRERTAGGLGESGSDGRTDERQVCVRCEGNGWPLASTRRGNYRAGGNEDVGVLRNGEGELHGRVCSGRWS